VLISTKRFQKQFQESTLSAILLLFLTSLNRQCSTLLDYRRFRLQTKAISRLAQIMSRGLHL
jgi:hypothetical protein